MNVNKLLVKKILEHPLLYSWSLQGFGMLRLYLSKEVRLHVWDSHFQSTPTPSLIHDHPWDFVSTVVTGEIKNVLYRTSTGVFPNFNMAEIQCGEGGHMKSKPQPVILEKFAEQTYCEGDVYSQLRTGIHSSHPEDGTVTIVKRQVPECIDPDHARVFWPIGKDWITVEPRHATYREIEEICARSLERWF